ncbi:MAG: polyprenyl synthetase family protein [Clostridia bacterium]|nr:polyprenyl synthetase family protein [Clostridia bacterium]
MRNELTKNDVIKMLDEDGRLVEKALHGYLAANDIHLQVLLDAERYSIFAGGKRIRPSLVLEFCRLFGGEVKAALPFACAVEMIHTYSLIHDDLPCMDDDELRRGRPTCHRQFGEANALLAGDALLTYAFEITAQNKHVTDLCATEAVVALAKAAGSLGMVGGQVIDLIGETKPLDFTTLLRLHRLKTGAMIKVSALLGCMAAGLGKGDMKSLAATDYAEKIGLVFQIIDDILDVTGDEKMLGKACGNDAAHNKTTFMTYFSPEDARKYAGELTDRAVASIHKYPGSERLCALAYFLLDREY